MDRIKGSQSDISSGSRPGRHISWPVFGLTVVIMSILAAVMLLPVSRQLTIKDDVTGEILFITGIQPGDCFSVKYVHSVNKSPIEDFFEVLDDNSILLRKTIFLSFGAGVPAELEEGQVLDVDDDRIQISNINRRMDILLLKVGTVAGHTLCVGDREVRLDSLAEPMRTVRLEVRSVPFIYILRGTTNE